MASEIDSYFVAVKAFLERDGAFFIFKDKYGDWDIPGGRIQKHEFEIPLEKILDRKMREELGTDVHYSLGKPIVFMRHERQEFDSKMNARIFALGYQATLTQGEIALSGQHRESLWASFQEFDPSAYFTGGWLKGVEEYLALKRT